MNCELTEADKEEGISYPIGLLDDIKIYFQHYKSFDETKGKWNSRLKRMHWDNMYVIMVEGKDCSGDLLRRLDRLPFKNKVIFTSKDMENIKSSFHIPYSEENGHVMDLCNINQNLQVDVGWMISTMWNLLIEEIEK